MHRLHEGLPRGGPLAAHAGIGRRRENALYLVFKVAQRLEHSWRPLNGGQTVMTVLLRGARFVDGVYVPQSAEVTAA